jgi:hypothetical protein
MHPLQRVSLASSPHMHTHKPAPSNRVRATGAPGAVPTLLVKVRRGAGHRGLQLMLCSQVLTQVCSQAYLHKKKIKRNANLRRKGGVRVQKVGATHGQRPPVPIFVRNYHTSREIFGYIVGRTGSAHAAKYTRHCKNIIEHETGAIFAEEHRIHTTFTPYSQQNAQRRPWTELRHRTTCIGRVPAHGSAPRLRTLAILPEPAAQPAMGHWDRP